MEQENRSVDSMLTIINLYVIDKIFNETASFKLSPISKMIYINCLIHHFRDKPATVVSAVSFEVFEEDIPNYNKFKVNFQELHKAKLITIGSKQIVFDNVWGEYIDRSKLEKVSAEKYVAGFKFQSISEFKDDLLKSSQLVELAQMKYRLSKLQTQKLIELFIVEQTAFDKKYNNLADCIKHCSYWMAFNSERVPKENVKSSGKILGKD